MACMLVVASVAGQVMKYIFGHPTVYGLVDLFNVNRKQMAELKMYWATLVIGFVYMAIDEFAKPHENVGFNIDY